MMKKEINNEGQKKILLDILIAIDSFCDKEKIRYSLGYGTLLGAARHKGFIPWDDDVDLIMQRQDYNRFCDKFPRDGVYRLYDCHNTPGYIYPYAKVADSRTQLVMNNSNIPMGINIDIFPIDDLADSREESWMIFKRVRCYKKLFLLKGSMPSSLHTKLYNIAVTIGKVLLFPVRLSTITKKYVGATESLISPKSVYVGNATLARKCDIFPREIFNNYTTLLFEGREFSCVSGYEILLENLYGNWKKLPPEEKRVAPHSAIGAYWKN